MGRTEIGPRRVVVVPTPEPPSGGWREVYVWVDAGVDLLVLEERE